MSQNSPRAQIAPASATHPILAFARTDAAAISQTVSFGEPAPSGAILSGPRLSPALSGMSLLEAAVPMSLDGKASMTFVVDTQATAGGSSSGLVHVGHNSDQAMRADTARSEYATRGIGVKIGILSDSFNLLGGEAKDIAEQNLPHATKILKEGATGGHDEGRAMAELIDRSAPGAQIDFYSGTGGEADMAAGIAALQADGCKIIVDDVAYLDEPFFQDGGVLQTAVEKAVAGGVNYFTSASNEGTDFYQNTFSATHTLLRGLPGAWTVNNFGGAGAAARPYVNVTIPNNGTAYIDLQWDQAFASISGGAGATSSLAMALYTADGQLVGTAGSLALGHDPRQLLQFTNTTGQTNFRLVILSNASAPPPSQFKFIVYGNGTVNDPHAGIGSGTVTGHELVAGANTVGAVNADNSAALGGTNTVESYSSVGSGQILFDAQGHRLANPISTNKVSFLAPDGTATSVFSSFFGTSASAPNAAAVAALMLQVNPYLTTAEVSQDLALSAAHANGPSGSTGAGLIQADVAVGLAKASLHIDQHHI